MKLLSALMAAALYAALSAFPAFAASAPCHGALLDSQRTEDDNRSSVLIIQRADFSLCRVRVRVAPFAFPPRDARRG